MATSYRTLPYWDDLSGSLKMTEDAARQMFAGRVGSVLCEKCQASVNPETENVHTVRAETIIEGDSHPVLTSFHLCGKCAAGPDVGLPRVYLVGVSPEDYRSAGLGLHVAKTAKEPILLLTDAAEAANEIMQHASEGARVFAVVVGPTARHRLPLLRMATNKLGARLIVPDSVEAMLKELW